MCFAFDEMGEEGDVVPVLNGCELGEVVKVFSDEGKFEVVEMVFESFGLDNVDTYGIFVGSSV